MFSSLGSKVAVYSRKLQWFFFDHNNIITLSPDIRVHRAGSQLKRFEVKRSSDVGVTFVHFWAQHLFRDRRVLSYILIPKQKITILLCHWSNRLLDKRKLFVIWQHKAKSKQMLGSVVYKSYAYIWWSFDFKPFLLNEHYCKE